jgi:hypothetical protein
MTTQTRHSVFETNSSSTHSISICHNVSGVYDTLPINNGVVHIYGGEFGWEQETYYFAESKADYCAQYAHDDPELCQMLKEVIMEVTGATDVIIEVNGYIDHQSFDVPARAFKDKDTLKDFIFNPDSYFETDNDNH